MKISVCLATYNGEKFLREQLISILSQLADDDEVVISDDGSTDSTIHIIDSLKDSRIRLYTASSGNLIKNFENALKNAKGDIIFLADQDDVWSDCKVEKYLPYFEKNILVFSNAMVFYETSGMGQELLYRKNSLTGFLRNLYKNNYIGATMAFRSNLLKYALPFPEKIPMHDIWLGLLAEMIGSTYYINTPLLYYRRHGNNASTTGKKSSNSLLKKIELRYRILFLVIIRIIHLNKKQKRNYDYRSHCSLQ